MNLNQKIACLVLMSACSFIPNISGQMTHKPDHIMVMADQVKWVDAPASLPPGAMVSVIEGDPKAAGLFTMRLKIPKNYSIKPHFHPADEHVTVIKGKFNMGVGEQYNEAAARELTTGSFAVMIVGTRHYAFAKKPCIIQLHGMGPWGITYVNPEDDPRNKK